MALFDLSSREIETDKMLFWEAWKSKNDAFSVNIGGSMRNVGSTLGYTPNTLLHAMEVHGGFFLDLPDLFHGKISPKIGIGVTAKW